jgi:hypothetical protein
MGEKISWVGFYHAVFDCETSQEVAPCAVRGAGFTLEAPPGTAA